MDTKRPDSGLWFREALGPRRADLSKVMGLVALVIGLFGWTSYVAAGEFCVSCTGPTETYLCHLPDELNAPRGTAGQLYCITELAKQGGHQACSVKRRAEATPCQGVERVLAPPVDGAPNLPFAQPAPSAPEREGTSGASGPEPLMTPALKEPAPGQAVTTDVDREPSVGRPGDEVLPDDEPLVDGAQPVEEAAPVGPPKTVEEMAKRSLQSSKENLNAAGTAVGNTAKSAGKTVSNVATKTGEQLGKAGSAVGSAAKKTWKCLSSLFSDC